MMAIFYVYNVDMKHRVSLPAKRSNDDTKPQGEIEATYGRLYKAFGEPDTLDEASGIPTYMWIRGIDGTVVSVYGAIGSRWTVGGSSVDALKLVTEALAERA